MWQTGTAQDYFDLLDKLEQIATGRHMATAAINAGGTGYTVGDILSIVGGTNTFVAKVEVTTVAAGVITGLRISTGGAYTADPTTTANAVTGGTGSSATVNLSMLPTGWTTIVKSKRGLSATIAAGGTGYAVNDEIEVDGGLGIGASLNVEAAVFVVSTVSAGVVTGVTVKSTAKGRYEDTPTNAVTTTTLVGTGNGCTLNVTYEDINDDHSVLVMAGAATGAPDPVQVAFWTYEGTQGIFEVRNWMLLGFSSAYDTNALLRDQSGVNYGIDVSANPAVPETYCCNLPLKDNDGGGVYPLEFYFSISDRRIMMAVRNQTATVDSWVTAYLGFCNQFGTTTELPYPLVIAGSASTSLTAALDVSVFPVTTSIVHQLTSSGNTFGGPGAFLAPSGQWRWLTNGSLSAANAFTRINEFNTTPFGIVNVPNQVYEPGFAIIATAGQFDWTEMCNPVAAQTPEFEFYPSPDTTDTQKYVLIPVTVIEGTGTGNELGDVWYPLGELDGCWWFSYAGGGVGAAALDYMDIGGDRYRVFKQGHRSELATDFFVFREA